MSEIMANDLLSGINDLPNDVDVVYPVIVGGFAINGRDLVLQSLDALHEIEGDAACEFLRHWSLRLTCYT